MSVKYKIRDQQGLHFFTCTICGWLDLFSRTVFREVILDIWRYCQEHKGLQIWGFVFMTNHIHFIANAKAPHRLEDILRDFKAHTAKKILELLHDGKTQESRREWLLYLFQYFGKRLKNTRHQVWIHDNHPVELYTEAVVIQKLRYIHNNPVEANWVKHPEDWIYSSASNYAEGKGVFEVQLLWTGFDEDGGWFFGNVNYPTLDE